MSSFIQIDYSTNHSGVARAENAVASLKGAFTHFSGARAGASLLLAAIVASLMVVANQVIDTWGEGHLLAAWMVLWMVAFVALALLAGPARGAVASLRAQYGRWAEALRRQEEDERTWNAALYDARIMADLSRAMNGMAVDNVRRYY